MGFSASKFIDAIEKDDIEALETAINKGFDVNTVFPQGSCSYTIDVTPLHIAAGHNNVGFVKLLLKSGASIGALDGNDQTALGLAAASGRLEAVDALLIAGADPYAGPLETTHSRIQRGLHFYEWAVDGFVETPLSEALRFGRLNVAKRLIAMCAAPSQQTVKDWCRRFAVARDYPIVAGGFKLLVAADWFDVLAVMGDTLRATSRERFNRSVVLVLITEARRVSEETGVEITDWGIFWPFQIKHYFEDRFTGDDDKIALNSELTAMRFDLLQQRAAVICFAMHSADLPALLLLMVIDEACNWAHLASMHVKWKWITAIKHHDKRS